MSGERLFVGSCAGTFSALDAHTGEPIWTYDITRDARARHFYGRVHLGELLIVATQGEGAHIYAFDPRNGAVRWKRATDVGSATDVVADADALYVVTLDDELLRLERQSGSVSWSHASGPVAPEARTMGSTPAAGDGRVFFGAANGTLQALEASTGVLVWRRDLGAEVTTSVLLQGDSLYLGLADGRLVRVGAAAGEVQAKTTVQPYPGGALVAAGGQIVVMLAPNSADSEVAAFDEDLRPTWRTRAPRGYWTTARPVVQGSQVIAGNSTGLLYAYQLQGGALAWTHAVDPARDWDLDNVQVIGVHAARLFVGSIGGTLYALEVSRGEADG